MPHERKGGRRMIVIKNKRARDIVRYTIPCVLIPLLVYLGSVVFDARRHLIISFGVALLAVILFFTGYEQKKTGSRRMVIVAVLTALCVAGRFIPLFKPVTALTVIAGIYLGCESGFLVGALAAAISNFYFGQGPWTAFQMLGWGMIGFIAGLLGRILKRHKALLLLYGVLAGVVYSFVMDIWTVLWYDGSFNWKLYAASVTAALPHTIVYAVSNFAFLWFLAKPFGEKLERVRIKYGV